ncbi:MAG: hypothetical protein AB7F86_01285 [Bdellovibrionales bacterium]
MAITKPKPLCYPQPTRSRLTIDSSMANTLAAVWSGFNPSSVAIPIVPSGNNSANSPSNSVENNRNSKRGRPRKQLNAETIRLMLKNNFTRAQIAQHFGVSKKLIQTTLNGKRKG